jgi:HEAT repeat protein
MPFWKQDDKLKLKELVKEEDTDKILSLLDKDRNILIEIAYLLEDNDPKVREKAAMALINNGCAVDSDFYFSEVENIVAPRIMKLLSDSNPEVRAVAASTVSCLPSLAYCGISKEEPELLEKTIPRLIELLEDNDIQVQRSAGSSLNAGAYLLLDTKKDYKTALYILSKLAENKEVLNRDKAAYFCITHGKKFPEFAKKMIPVLIKLTKDSDEGVRNTAERALKSLSE